MCKFTPAVTVFCNLPPDFLSLQFFEGKMPDYAKNDNNDDTWLYQGFLPDYDLIL